MILSAEWQRCPWRTCTRLQFPILGSCRATDRPELSADGDSASRTVRRGDATSSGSRLRLLALRPHTVQLIGDGFVQRFQVPDRKVARCQSLFLRWLVAPFQRPRPNEVDPRKVGAREHEGSFGKKDGPIAHLHNPLQRTHKTEAARERCQQDNRNTSLIITKYRTTPRCKPPKGIYAHQRTTVSVAETTDSSRGHRGPVIWRWPPDASNRSALLM